MDSGSVVRLGRYADKKDTVKARKSAEEIHEDFLEWYYHTYPQTDYPSE